MRRRHLRAVLRIEQQVYPRPWSTSLFLSELALRSTRAYIVARVGRELVGYAGLMMTLDDGHVTYGEVALDGETDDVFLLTTTVCHPALANDNLSGIVLLAGLARILAAQDLRHSFRLLAHGWDSQWRELKVWSATAREPARKSEAPG